MGGGHWARASASVIAEVRARLADGPVTASDLSGARKSRLVELVGGEARARMAVLSRGGRLRDAPKLEARL